MFKAYKKLMQTMNQNRIKMKMDILDNEAWEAFFQTIRWNGIEYKKVPLHMHEQNMTEKAISTFKDHLKAILAGVDETYPMHLWDRLLP